LQGQGTLQGAPAQVGQNTQAFDMQIRAPRRGDELDQAQAGRINPLLEQGLFFQLVLCSGGREKRWALSQEHCSMSKGSI
jgi:hypothetical protein